MGPPKLHPDFGRPDFGVYCYSRLGKKEIKKERKRKRKRRTIEWKQRKISRLFEATAHTLSKKERKKNRKIERKREMTDRNLKRKIKLLGTI